jgi:hypothetical protein
MLMNFLFWGAQVSAYASLDDDKLMHLDELGATIGTRESMSIET